MIKINRIKNIKFSKAEYNMDISSDMVANTPIYMASLVKTKNLMKEYLEYNYSSNLKIIKFLTSKYS